MLSSMFGDAEKLMNGDLVDGCSESPHSQASGTSKLLLWSLNFRHMLSSP